MFHHHRTISRIALLTLVLLAFLPAVRGSSQITYVGGSNNNAASVSSLTATYSSNSGSTIFVGFIFYNGAGQTINSITDSGGSRYSKVIEFFPDSFRDIGIWATPAGASVASTSFTVQFSASANFATMIVEEYTGIFALGSTTTNLEFVANTASNITATVSSPNDYAICFFGTPDALTTWAVTTGTLRHFALAQYPMESIDNAGGSVCASTPNSAVRWAAVSVDAQPLTTVPVSGSAGPPPQFLNPVIGLSIIGTFIVAGLALIVKGSRRKAP